MDKRKLVLFFSMPILLGLAVIFDQSRRAQDLLFTIPPAAVVPLESVQNSLAPVGVPVQRKLAFSSAKKNSDWKEFKSKFGAELEPTFSDDGKLVRILGHVNQGTKASGNFHPDDPQKVIARAHEVLKAASHLLKLQKEWPLEDPRVSGNEVSAQVSFHETHLGIPLSPYGGVKLDLGADGELLELASQYVPEVQVSGAKSLDAQSAQTKAIAAVMGGGHAEGGSEVIWATSAFAQNGPVLAYHAYEYMVDGRQVIVDAQNGKVLFRRDRRQY